MPMILFETIHDISIYTQENINKHVSSVNVADTFLQRSRNDRNANMQQGYIAENIVKDVLRNVGYPAIHYNNIRNDGGIRNAPFDLITYDSTIYSYSEAVDTVREHLINEGRVVTIPYSNYKKLQKVGFRTVEVKSSKFYKSHLIDGVPDTTHPHFGCLINYWPVLKNKKSSISTMAEYKKFTNSTGNFGHFMETYYLTDMLFRVFLHTYISNKAVVIGVASREAFIHLAKPHRYRNIDAFYAKVSMASLNRYYN